MTKAIAAVPGMPTHSPPDVTAAIVAIENQARRMLFRTVAATITAFAVIVSVAVWIIHCDLVELGAVIARK